MADVVISFTIPSAYVTRLSAAVTNSYKCEQKVITQVEVPVLDDMTGEPTGETEMVDEVSIVTLDPKSCLIRHIKKQILNLVNVYEKNLAEKVGKDAYNTAYKNIIDGYVDFIVE